MEEHVLEDKKTVGNDDSVGYGKPPKASQFRKGQSGNPRGRPKNAKSTKTLIAAALNEKVVVNENGQRKIMTKRELGAKQVANGFARGDYRSVRLTFELIGEREEREEQASVAATGSAARERITAKLNRLRERMELFRANSSIRGANSTDDVAESIAPASAVHGSV